MPQTDYHIHNSHRAYPFVESPEPYYELLAGARVYINSRSGYFPGKHFVVLEGVGVITSGYASRNAVPEGPYVAMKIDGLDSVDTYLLFPFGNGESYDEVAGVEVTAIPSNDPETPVRSFTGGWGGWVIRGPADFTQALPPGWRLQLEPGCVVLSPNTGANAVVSGTRGKIHVYNRINTQYSYPANCDPPAQPPQLDGFYALATDIEDTVTFTGGHGTQVRFRPPNEIQVIASPQGGVLPLSCEPIAVGEESGVAVYDTDISPRCNQILRSVNGLSGPILRFAGDNGITITEHTTLHRIVISSYGANGAMCPDNTPPIAVDYLPEQNGIPCGDNGQPLPDPGDPNEQGGFQVVSGQTLEKTSRTTTLPMGRWRSTGSAWELQYSPCLVNEAPAYPEIARPAGEEIETPCVPIEPDQEALFRNADLEHPVQLAAWTPSPGAYFIRDWAETYSSWVRLSPGATLTQHRLAVLPGKYSFSCLGRTINARGREIELVVTATNHENAAVKAGEKIQGPNAPGKDLHISSGAFYLPTPLIDFTIKNKSSDDIYVTAFALTRQ